MQISRFMPISMKTQIHAFTAHPCEHPTMHHCIYKSSNIHVDPQTHKPICPTYL